MKIEWNKVTRFSQIVAIVLFLVVYIVGFQVGRQFESSFVLGSSVSGWVTFSCDEGKVIQANFYKHFVHLEIGWGTLYLPQTISASGARYANDDESFVFWNKGNTAFVTQGSPSVTTFKNCMEVNSK